MAATLDALVDALGEDLRPTAPLPRPARPVTGVHISELPDPTPFLAGGELLLTTGLSLPSQVTPATGYVTRLVRAGVAALGFGLGPVHDTVPQALTLAAQRAGLPLLVVPVRTPFRTILTAYFAGERQAQSAELTGALGATHALVRAATHGEPDADEVRSQVIRVLAGAVDGWAAHLDADGRPDAVWPRSAGAAATRAAQETRRIRTGGALAGATFPLGGDDVLLQPTGIADGGYVVCGHARPIPGQMRHLTLAACAVLDLAAARLRDATMLRAVGPAVVGRLLALDLPDAAIAYVVAHGGGRPGSVRVGAVADPGGPTAARAGLPPDQLARHTDRDVTTWAWPAQSAQRAWSRVPRSPGATGMLGPPVPATRLAAEFERAATRLASLRPGQWVDLTARPPALDGGALHAADGADSRSPAGARGRPARPESARRRERSQHPTLPRDEHAVLEALAGYGRADLLGTLAAYLRARGRIEGAAAALGLHRNTIRHRLGLVARVGAVDVDDPDVAARLWLALRARGEA